MNYNISSSSPTDELLTLGRIFSEVGDYASTILDREHISLSRQCVTRLNKVVDELVSRKSILSAENLYDMPESEPVVSDLKSLSISDLHSLYRRWPVRHDERRANGRESWSFYYEGEIVREMQSRKAANKGEQLKIDYCATMYSNELSNMSFMFSRPVQIDNDKIYPDRERCYASEELTALIRLYKDYRDIIERELLVEYVDRALDLLEKEQGQKTCLGLLAEVAELGRKGATRVPKWVNKKIEDAVDLALSAKEDTYPDLPLAMLTLQIINNDQSLEQKAERRINRCYKSAFDETAKLSDRIENLHTAVICSDYVSRFSVRKVAVLWNELSRQALASEMRLTPDNLFRMLEIAKKCEGYAEISAESRERLKQMLEEIANSNNPLAQAYNRIAKLRC